MKFLIETVDEMKEQLTGNYTIVKSPHGMTLYELINSSKTIIAFGKKEELEYFKNKLR